MHGVKLFIQSTATNLLGTLSASKWGLEFPASAFMAHMQVPFWPVDIVVGSTQTLRQIRSCMDVIWLRTLQGLDLSLAAMSLGADCTAIQYVALSLVPMNTCQLDRATGSAPSRRTGPRGMLRPLAHTRIASHVELTSKGGT